MSKSWYERRLGAQPARSPYPSTPATPYTSNRPGPVQEEPYVPPSTGPLSQSLGKSGTDMDPRLRGEGMTKGAAAARAEAQTGNCPNCGSHLFFSQHTSPIMSQNGPVKSSRRCFSCNYNDGLYDLSAN